MTDGAVEELDTMERDREGMSECTRGKDGWVSE